MFIGIIFCMVEATPDVMYTFATHDNYSIMRDCISILRSKSNESKGDASILLTGYYLLSHYHT
jgi:hypothetical protein